MAIHKHIDFQVPGWGEFAGGPKDRLSYRGEVLSDSPLLYLRLGESSGPSVVDEAGGHVAAQIGVLAWGVPGALAFDPDTAVSSEGAGGLVVNETGWLPVGSSPRTLEAWFKADGSEVLFGGMIYGTEASGKHQNFTCTSNEVSISVHGCLYGVQGLGLSADWHHAALVFPVGATRCDEYLIYLDGVALSPTVISGSGAVLVDTSDSTLMVYQITTGAANNSAFDEVAIYGSALTGQRIADHYQAGTQAE